MKNTPHDAASEKTITITIQVEKPAQGLAILRVLDEAEEEGRLDFSFNVHTERTEWTA